MIENGCARACVRSNQYTSTWVAQYIFAVDITFIWIKRGARLMFRWARRTTQHIFSIHTSAWRRHLTHDFQSSQGTFQLALWTCVGWACGTVHGTRATVLLTSAMCTLWEGMDGKHEVGLDVQNVWRLDEFKKAGTPWNTKKGLYWCTATYKGWFSFGSGDGQGWSSCFNSIMLLPPQKKIGGFRMEVISPL